MTKRSPYKKGDKITTNQMREIHGTRYARFVPRGPFTVTQVIKTEHNSGGYRIIANGAKKGVVVSWEMFFAQGRGTRGGKVLKSFNGPLMVIDPEAQQENMRKGMKRAKSASKRAVNRPATTNVYKVMPSGTSRAKVLLTLSQFDGDDL